VAGREVVFTGIPTRIRSGRGASRPFLGQGNFRNRLSIPITVDYVPISTHEYYDTDLASDARFREQYAIINPPWDSTSSKPRMST